MLCTHEDNLSGPSLWLYDMFSKHADLPAHAGEMAMRDFSLVMRTKILAALLGQSEGALDFYKTEHGKPYVKNDVGLRFSVSHTGSLWGMAVILHNEEIGLDLERGRARKFMDQMMAAKFHAVEQEVYAGLGEQQARKSYFYKLWTQKEAYAKRMGLGLGYDFAAESFNARSPAGEAMMTGHIMPADKAQDIIYLALACSTSMNANGVVLKGDKRLNTQFTVSSEP